MSYVNSIGGDPINPNPFSYTIISVTANTAYTWDDLADWIDITASSTYTITMPPANEVGTGQEIVFYNYGANTITINNYGAASITTVPAGIIKRLWVTNNTTTTGTWRSSNIGTGNTTADASALAGYGMKAISGALSQDTPPILYNTNQTLGLTHRAGVEVWTGGAGIFSLTAPATLTSGWFTMVRNSGTGILQILPLSGNIDGAASISMATGEGFTITTDGNNFYTLGRVSSATTGKTLLNKSVAGAVNVTLSSTEESYDIINLSGVITANISVNVSTAIREWIFYNGTSGAFTLTIKTSSGSGVQIPQGSKMLFYSDGTNVVSTDYPPYFDTTVMIKGSVDQTKQFRFEADGLTTATTRVYTMPDADTTFVGTDFVQTITNKTIQASTLRDSDVAFVDNADATKKLAFQCSSITTATTRTATMPDADLTFVGVDLQQTLTNKKLSDSTFQIVDNADNTKQVEFQVSGITTATKRTYTFPNYDATFATQAGTETLTNKSLSDSTVLFVDNADNTKKLAFECSSIATGTTRTVTIPDESGTAAYVRTPITNSLGANVTLSNTGLYFDGPSVAQGSTGTWFASGTVTLQSAANNSDEFEVKLWDGTTVIASTQTTIQSLAPYITSVSLSGYLASPVGNLRISVKCTISTDASIAYNASGNSKDSTISAFRIV